MERQGSVPYVAAAGLISILESLNARHIAVDDILREMPFDLRQIEDKHELVPLQWLADLIEAGARQTGDSCFGLHCMDWMPLRLYSAPLYATINAPDLRTALTTLTHYLPIIASIRAIFDDRGATARIEWRLPDSVAPTTQLADFTLGRLVNYVRRAAGADWHPLDVGLTHGSPGGLAEYEQRLGKHIRFNQPVNSLVVDGAALSAPMPGADHVLFRILTRYCDLLLREARLADDPLARVREQMARRLAQGATLESTASDAGLTPDQLRRTLKRSNVSYKSLLDSTRQSLARHYLIDTDLPLCEVGARLGFSEQSAFSRAARRWFGTSPRQVRRQAD